jgi:hypothetical protein
MAQPTNRPSIKSMQAAAYHEAAHGVVSLVLGQRFEYIELCHEGATLSEGLKGLRRGRIQVDSNETVYRDGALREACISMAGIAANKQMFPKKSYGALTLEVGWADVNNWAGWLEYYCYGDKNAANKLELKLLGETRKLVRQHWDSIAKIGDKLIAQKRLTYDEVRFVVFAGTTEAETRASVEAVAERLAAKSGLLNSGTPVRKNR